MDEIYRTAIEYIDAYESAQESVLAEFCTHDVLGRIEDLRRECAEERARLAQLYEGERISPVKFP